MTFHEAETEVVAHASGVPIRLYVRLYRVEAHVTTSGDVTEKRETRTLVNAWTLRPDMPDDFA
ncbi:MAG: hypothetical protein EOP24_32160 [Hyphomicrobiales bacterium]|nr:MAG: hypothetical protein EOP24_32160 [Hyphomicrobiales bacterium]